MEFENLLGGAAAAAGPAPDLGSLAYRQWLGKVSSIASDLQRLAEAVVEHERRKEECMSSAGDGTKKHFYGKLVNAKTITKGSGEKTVTKGYLQFEAREDAQNVDEDGFEYIETAPLSTPAGRFEYDRAQSLVGQRVMVFKKLIPLPNGRKARECAAIDPADSPDFFTSNENDSLHPSHATDSSGRPSEGERTVRQPATEGGDTGDNTGDNTAEDLDALIEQAEAVFETSRQPAATTQDLPSAPPSGSGVALGEFSPTTETELVELVERHLGKTAADVKTFLVDKYNLPEGKKLPSRQYTVAWREMAGIQ